MALDYFPWRYNYCNKTAKLSDQELGRLVRALSKYGETGEREELAGRESIAFDFIADDIDQAKAAYKEKCEKNRQNGRMAATATDRYQTPPKNNIENKTNKIKNNNTVNNTVDSTVNEGGVVGDVLSDYLNRISPTASPYNLDILKGYAEVLGADVCKRAFDIALENNANNKWLYIKKILSNLQSQGVRCLADWEAIERERKSKGSGFSYDYGSTEGSL